MSEIPDGMLLQIVLPDEPIAPEGWAICDGQNGTPDLTSKFILHQQFFKGEDKTYSAVWIMKKFT